MNLKLILQAVDRWSGPTSKATGAIGGLIGRIGTLTGKLAKVSAIGGAVAGTVAVAAGLGLAKASWSMVKEAADAGDAAYNSAQKVGLTVQSYQRLAAAAKIANLESGEFNVGLRTLASNAVSAAEGSKEDAKAFAALGIKLKGANGKVLETDQLLAAIADRFATMPDGPLKTATAMRLLGRSGTEMIPLLNMGGAAIRKAGDEAERLGVVLSDDAAKAGDDFNDNLDRMKYSVLGLKIGIGAALLPTLNRAVVAITEWIAAHRVDVISKVSAVVSQLSVSLAKVDWIAFADGIGNALVLGTKLFVWIGGLEGIITGGGIAAIAGLTNGIFGLAVALGVATGPVGWIILAVGALAAGAFFLWRNWSKVSKWFGDMWTGLATKFKVGAAAVWNALPPWLRFILKGIAFVVKFASPVGAAASVAGAAVRAGAQPRPAVGAAARDGARGRVDVGIRVDQDGRVRATTARASGQAGIDFSRGALMASD
ncbi:MAG: hypothetical protein K9G59_07725 [Caulobacter sp.]|nr:hypothetical protein [Caulobacter sp.]